MKITVYAICKNEEKYIKRWYNSMKEADEIIVLDTGSTDNSVKLLKETGIKVFEKKIIPWRFDVARNESLKLVPKDTDLCVCTDLDEIFVKGWRKVLEDNYDGSSQVRYRYTWSFNKDGSEGFVFWIDKIHRLQNFKWEHPVHEVLVCSGESNPSQQYINGLQLNHYPDANKSRSQYLPLLELSVKENPDDDRNTHYLGREYMFNGQYDKAINTLKKHLSLPSANWADERCASMRFIGYCYLCLNNNQEAEKWYLKAVAEAPYLREPYINLAELYYALQNWYGVIFSVYKALNITERSLSYINEPKSFSSFPFELISFAFYKVENYTKALFFAEKALSLSPENDVLKNNIEIYKNLIK